MQVTWWLWAVLLCLNNSRHLHFQRICAAETRHRDKSCSRETRLGDVAATLPLSSAHTLISAAAACRELYPLTRRAYCWCSDFSVWRTPAMKKQLPVEQMQDERCSRAGFAPAPQPHDVLQSCLKRLQRLSSSSSVHVQISSTSTAGASLL